MCRSLQIRKRENFIFLINFKSHYRIFEGWIFVRTFIWNVLTIHFIFLFLVLRNALGALPARRIRASSGFAGMSSAGSGRPHWRSLAGLEVADMAAKNIKVKCFVSCSTYLYTYSYIHKAIKIEIYNWHFVYTPVTVCRVFSVQSSRLINLFSVFARIFFRKFANDWLVRSGSASIYYE